MPSHIAIAHYPEGAGHATRMLGVAQALETAGATITIAGGGPGSQFIECNGYDVTHATPVAYITDYQDTCAATGSLHNVLTNSLPNTARRIRDLTHWLQTETPDALVTDDMFAAVAAHLTRTPLYVVTHNAASFYDAVLEQLATWTINQYQRRVATSFLYPALWPPSDRDPTGAIHTPPIALDPADAPTPEPAPDVLLVPSVYSDHFDELATTLRHDGHDVTLVGDDDWDPVPALLPWIRAADVVVCSGYSTMMEAAIAETPCIVYPFTDEQHGVTRRVERHGITGFQVEHSHAHVRRAVAHPPDDPHFENGTPIIADHVLATTPDPTAHHLSTPNPSPADD